MQRIWITAAMPALLAIGCGGGGGGGSKGGLSIAPATTGATTKPAPITTNTTGGIVVTPKPGTGTGPVTSGSTGPVTSSGTVVKTPIVLTVTPKSAAQGAQITLAGTNLDQASDVRVGGVPLVNAVAVPAEIKGTLGAHAAGAVDITLKDKAGKTLTYSGLFTYLAPPVTTPAPAVTTVTPATAAQGAAITINGTNLDQAASVTVGGVALTGITIAPASIKGTLGNHAAGAVDIVITDKAGKTYTVTGKFTYLAPPVTAKKPVVTKVTPDKAAPGDTVTVTGTDL
ncbi:MAG: IPT/TIG domain-containing protein, partial [Planctomycetota bacterium]